MAGFHCMLYFFEGKTLTVTVVLCNHEFKWMAGKYSG